MGNGNFLKNKTIFRRAITLLVIVFLFLGLAIVSAKKIGDKEFQEITDILKITNFPFLGKYSEKDLKEILNEAVKPKEQKITYGVLILSAFDEIEFMDMILTQKYKSEAREYFNSILDKKLSLAEHWRSTGKKFYDVWKQGESAGPASSLAMEIVPISQKTIEIFIAFGSLKNMKTYDGLWYYFNLRKQGNEPHEVAWQEAKIVMGWAARSTSFYGGIETKNQNEGQLEAQFSALYEKWSPYATPNGISEAYKKQVRDEFKNKLASVLEAHNFAEENPSFADNVKISWQELVQRLEKVKLLAQETASKAGAVLSQISPFQAGIGLVQLPESETEESGIEIETEFPAEEAGEAESKQLEQPVSVSIDSGTPAGETGEPEPPFDDAQGEEPDLSAEVLAEAEPEPEAQPELEPESEAPLKEETPSEEPETENQESEEQTGQLESTSREEQNQLQEEKPTEEPQKQEESAITICENPKTEVEPSQDQVIFNEIAWMGTSGSSNDEWMELKNISSAPIDLSGWQIYDKDRQIEIVFPQAIVKPAGFFLLERTDDTSVPEVPADYIYKGALNNSEEALYLFDNNCQLQDKVLADPDWPAGDVGQKASMEKNSASDYGGEKGWHTYNGLLRHGIYGSPKAENGPAAIPPEFSGGFSAGSGSNGGSEEENGSANEAEAGTEESQQTTGGLPIEVLITEIQLADATSSSHDFIELYNQATSAVNISGFQLKKRTSSGSEYSIRVFPENSIIAGQAYFLWANYGEADVTSTQTLAKDNSIAFLDKEKNIIDEVAWGSSSTSPFVENSPFNQNPAKNETLGRKWSTSTEKYIDTDNNSADFEIQTPTPKSKNQPKTSSEESENKSKNENKNNENGGEQGGNQSPSLSVVINEIAWMGTSATHSADEWIELFNNTTSTIDVSGWTLRSSDGSLSIIFSSTTASTTIPGKGYFLLERTDDQTISDIPADQIYTGILSNSGEKLELRDAEGNLIDLVDSSQGWFAGTTTPSYISMERIDPTASGTDPANWANNNRISRTGLDAENDFINGTPKSENSVSRASTTISRLTLTEDLVLTRLGSPYFVSEEIIVPENISLTIEPGVVIKFEPRTYCGPRIKVEGKMQAQGGQEDQQKIIFTSSKEEPVAGDWEFLEFKNSQLQLLENVVLKYGGRLCGKGPYVVYGQIFVDGGDLTIKNSLIAESPTQGIRLVNNASATIDQVEFKNIWSQGEGAAAIYLNEAGALIKNSAFNSNKIGILIVGEAEGTIENNFFEGNQTPIQTNTFSVDFSGNTTQNNNINGIVVDGIIFLPGQNQIEWKKADLPYVIKREKNIPFGKTLNIAPGVVVKIWGKAGIRVDGTLKAEGREDEKIIFTSFQDDSVAGDTNNNATGSSPLPGNWNYIYFSASSTNSSIKNAEVRYGGWYNVFLGGPDSRGGAIKAEGSSIKIESSTIEKNLFSGVELINSASTVIKDTIFRNHQDNAKAVFLENSNPSIDNCVFENNSCDIYVNSQCRSYEDYTNP
jgi:hypothetical protein